MKPMSEKKYRIDRRIRRDGDEEEYREGEQVIVKTSAGFLVGEIACIEDDGFVLRVPDPRKLNEVDGRMMLVAIELDRVDLRRMT